MRAIRPASSARTWFVCLRLRFRLVDFLVRMWLRLAWPHLNLPEAVLRKRFAAPRWVLILGIADVLSGSCNWPGRWRGHSFRPARSGCKSLIAKESRSEEHTSELQSLMRISYAVFCLKK